MKLFSLKALKISFLSVLFLLVFCTCRRQLHQKGQNSPDHGINSYAKRFSIISGNGYSRLIITDPWQGAGEVIQKWYLVKSGKRHPPGIKPEETISVPVRKIVCLSTTHLAMISALKEYNSVKGFSGIDFIYDPIFRKMAQKEMISEVGYEDNLNKELILKISPDLVVAYGIGAESAGYVSKLKELGVKVMFDADYLEEDPLGKSEWIKVIGALYGKEQMADSIFSSVVQRYSETKKTVSTGNGSRPVVLLGLPFRDTWYVSPGNSYVSRLIADAGGKYIFSNTTSSFAMPMGIEAVYLKALEADYWLNTSTVTTAGEISAMDSRFSGLPAFKKGHVYNNNNRINKDGGNDYWEGGTMNPDIILKDIASIIHPGLFPGWQLYYYRKIN